MNGLSPFVRHLRRKLAGLVPGLNRFSVQADGLPVHFRVQFVPGARRMVVSLHGAADRAARKGPVFNGFNADLVGVHQVAVSDPSLQLPGEFRLAWFAGHTGFDTPALLRRAFAEMARAWEIERTIFFGTSGGGFAALVQSHAMPGSMAVVGNPQTRIARYHAPLVTPYRQACWPELADNADLDTVTTADCTRLYGAGFRNAVIYVQSLGDRHHRCSHMLPFAAAIAGRANAGRVLFHSDFHGVHGHSLPRAAYADWLRAAAISTTTAPADVLETWHGLRLAQPAGAAPPDAGGLDAGRPNAGPAAPSASARLEAWLARQAAAPFLPETDVEIA